VLVGWADLYDYIVPASKSESFNQLPFIMAQTFGLGSRMRLSHWLQLLSGGLIVKRWDSASNGPFGLWILSIVYLVVVVMAIRWLT